jgi:ATP-dependent RNA helicase DeaD
MPAERSEGGRRRIRRRGVGAGEGASGDSVPADARPREPRAADGGGDHATAGARRGRRSGGAGARGPSLRRGGEEALPADLPPTAFAAHSLPERLLAGLARAGYSEPTEIQARLVPVALTGRNVVARSRTGTGKTCAFLVPALARLAEVREPISGAGPVGPPRVLVVTPTRELAVQVAAESEKIARFLPVVTACVYGGTRLSGQVRSLGHAAVVVGTPGRLLDHLGRGTFDASRITLVVLDEVDRMYDLGFRDDVDRLLRATPAREQVILVSATLNEDVERLVAKHVGDHERILIESRTATVDEVQQDFYIVEPDRKRELLRAILEARRPERAIVFVRTRFTADRVAYALQQSGFDAQEIHSGLPQGRREAILQAFRDGRLALLVATDVAARGLDIQGVDHVINYDIPENPEDYVHRVGRTARMGQEGWAVTLVTPNDGIYVTAIEKLTNHHVEMDAFAGFAIKARPEKSPEAPARTAGIPQWTRPARRRR